LSEPCQHHGVFPGTHHFADYVLYICGAIFPVFLYSNNKSASSKVSAIFSVKIYSLSLFIVLFYFTLAFGADVVGSSLGVLIDNIFGPYLSGNI